MRTSVGFFMSREDRIYDKPPKTTEEMVVLLESRNLLVPDRERALHYLRFINYYRLSGYGFLFENPHVGTIRSHRFPDGTTFEHLLNIYVFDRQLRLLVMEAIERVEVGVRTVLAYELSHKYGTGHWFMNERIFKENLDLTHEAFIQKIKVDTALSAEAGSDRHSRREPFISHYYDNYNSPELPPSWMLIEVLSLGTWSKVYANLRDSRDRKCIARVLDLSPAKLESWLHSLTYLRNLCAHHSRIYGRKLLFPPAMRDEWPELPPFAFSRFMAVLIYLLRKMSPDTGWRDRVRDLIESEPQVQARLLGIENTQFWDCVS